MTSTDSGLKAPEHRVHATSTVIAGSEALERPADRRHATSTVADPAAALVAETRPWWEHQKTIGDLRKDSIAEGMLMVSLPMMLASYWPAHDSPAARAPHSLGMAFRFLRELLDNVDRTSFSPTFFLPDRLTEGRRGASLSVGMRVEFTDVATSHTNIDAGR